jgi:inner membrane protein
MDNATHTLAALLLAELALAARGRGGAELSRGLRPAALAVSVIANNFPDLDFLYARLSGEKLGYLLHHRGHTHTLALALPQAVLALASVAPFVRRAALSRRDWAVLALLALAGPVVHIGMDFSNNYGVHPFWPLSNRWHYGDFVFIVEPLLFAAMAPALFWSARTLWGRALSAVTLGVVLALTFVSGIVPLAMRLVVTALGVGFFVALRRARPPTCALAGALAVATVVLGFFATSRLAQRRLSSAAAELFPGYEIVDVVVSPLPASPLCFDFILVQTRGDRYVLRPGLLALAPVSTAFCGRGIRRGRTLKLEREAPAAPDLELAGRFEAPVAVLGELARQCQSGALLRFARAPFFLDERRTTTRIVGDARYDREPGLGFAELRIDPASAACPRFVPPWEPPRSALWQ